MFYSKIRTCDENIQFNYSNQETTFLGVNTKIESLIQVFIENLVTNISALDLYHVIFFLQTGHSLQSGLTLQTY